MSLSELSVIARIRDRFPGGRELVDDCGAVPPPLPGQRLLVTTDLMEDGQHFSRAWHPPALLGRKLLAVNLSDLDASGATFLGFTLTLALGRDLAPAWVEAFLDGLAAASHAWSVPVLGGDTVGRASGLGLGITAFGSVARWLRRDTVEADDGIYVDQPLGASLRGLRKLMAGWDPAVPDPDVAAHLDPQPRLGLGPRLAAIPEVHACMDISDGLSRDLANLATASGLSVILAPGLDADAVEGGEDYARCFAAALPQAELERRLGIPLLRVGTAAPAGEAPVLHYDGGSLRPLPDRAFDHFAPAQGSDDRHP
ncbi:thiamine-phosphate kinase [Mesoterricola sediminis]|uniref:Thiamine-monophosphate kinase n=1 Tax=Mesoterricola sediminis TaxID=2927980 RepID=A0AA48GUB4_9BACT|nr:AIR synthase related protein [Mesoterricola sediminis]BDU76364.1 thiamine-monophosphate kinase [Mesoterricola sediminis]